MLIIILVSETRKGKFCEKIREYEVQSQLAEKEEVQLKSLTRPPRSSRKFPKPFP